MITKIKLFIMSMMAIATVGATPVLAADSGTKCGSTKTQFIACDTKTGLATIGDLIKIALLVLTVLIGTVAVGGLAYAGIIYASAHDDQNKVNESKTIIRNIVIGLILYGFTIAIINWLVPATVVDAPASPAPTASGAPAAG